MNFDYIKNEIKLTKLYNYYISLYDILVDNEHNKDECGCELCLMSLELHADGSGCIYNLDIHWDSFDEGLNKLQLELDRWQE